MSILLIPISNVPRYPQNRLTFSSWEEEFHRHKTRKKEKTLSSLSVSFQPFRQILNLVKIFHTIPCSGRDVARMPSRRALISSRRFTIERGGPRQVRKRRKHGRKWDFYSFSLFFFLSLNVLRGRGGGRNGNLAAKVGEGGVLNANFNNVFAGQPSPPLWTSILPRPVQF